MACLPPPRPSLDPPSGLCGAGSGQQAVPASSHAAGHPASRTAQAGALLRKNAVYQRRNCCSNVCLLSAPIFFCLMLMGLQLALSKLLFSGEEYTCGCKCTRCCYLGDPSNCTVTEYGVCPYECLERDRSSCGIQYSLSKQTFYCSIPHTSVWPALSQIPATQDRAAPYKPRLAYYYTGRDPAAAAAMGAALLPPPNVTLSSLVSLQEYQSSLPGMFGGGAEVAPGELLSMVGLNLGTTAWMSLAGLYLETGLTGEGEREALWPEGTCQALELAGRKNISLSDMLGAMIKASNPPDTAELLNAALQGALGASSSNNSDNNSSSTGGSGGDSSSSVTGGTSSALPPAAMSLVGSNLRMNCTDVVAKEAGSPAVLQRHLYCGFRQARCGGESATNQYAAAFDFRDSDSHGFATDVYYNDTYAMPPWANPIVGPAVYQRIAQNIDLAINAWLKTVTGGRFSTKLLGVQETPKQPSAGLNLDFSSILGPLFFTWVFQMLLPVFVMQLVYEKEKGLRMMMKMHGLGDSAYWLVTYSWFLLLYCVYIFGFVLFGSVVGLTLFTKNAYGIQAITYFIFGNTMIGLAFLLSCFFKSSRTATVVAYLTVFGSGCIASLLLRNSIESKQPHVMLLLLELIPSFAIYRVLYEFGAYAFVAVFSNSFGMSWRDLQDPDNGTVEAWVILLVEWVVFMVLAWYLEQVLDSGAGNRRHPLFFLDCLRKGKQRPRRNSCNHGPLHQVLTMAEDEPADVAAERARVAGLREYAENPIVLRDLRKEYPGHDGQPPKLAVKTLSLGIRRGECFGLLGPNGAGKTTSIALMTGLQEPCQGSAIIGGHDICGRDTGAVYTLMGLCPQEHMLWDTLTGREHLMFYGRLKGLQGAELAAAVEEALRQVNLSGGSDAADRQTRHYSGGMKRRLSVAISFMGNPLVVYLDEPSTGLDPASRRNLWEVVKAHKPGRAMVLTTHSMQEAEVLCDRLGVLVDGQLVCIGDPKEITSRYGGYLVFTIMVPSSQVKAARALVLRMSPNARLTYSVGGTLKFELPSSEVSLSSVFREMLAVKSRNSSCSSSSCGGGGSASGGSTERLQVLDWGVANPTLEEVFIKLARQYGAKAV